MTARIFAVALATVVTTATAYAQAPGRHEQHHGLQQPKEGCVGAGGMMGGMTGDTMRRSGMMADEMVRHMSGAMTMTMMGMGAAGPGPGMILRLREPLGLTGEQIARLETLQENTAQERARHLTAVREAEAKAVEALAGEDASVAEYETRLREAANHGVEAQVALARAAIEARAVLSEEQRSNLGCGMRTMMQGMQRDGGASGASASGTKGAGGHAEHHEPKSR
ncbi:MAG: Spy/CpxP family protein refolding chaperone [Gemmatimonadetes bacterium]|nr:Spy/CpxP family protein refolding chaperone [Gemmatimonadota bacterium]